MSRWQRIKASFFPHTAHTFFFFFWFIYGDTTDETLLYYLVPSPPPSLLLIGAVCWPCNRRPRRWKRSNNTHFGDPFRFIIYMLWVYPARRTSATDFHLTTTTKKHPQNCICVWLLDSWHARWNYSCFFFFSGQTSFHDKTKGL